jgi:hypothetical protein
MCYRLIVILMSCLFLQATQAQSTCFRFELSSTEAVVGDTVRLQLSTKGFQEIVSVQFGVTWDTSQLRFLAIDKDQSPLNDISIATLLAYKGELRMIWWDNNVNGVSIADDVPILDLFFVVQSGQTAFLPVWVNDQIPNFAYEVGSLNNGIFPYKYRIGGVYANGAQVPEPLEIGLCTTTSYCANGGNANAVATNAQLPVTYKWFQNQTQIATGDNVSNLVAGLYTLQAIDASGKQSDIRFRMKASNASLNIEVDSICQPYCNRPLGCIDLSLNPANGPYSVNWSDIGAGPEVRTGLAKGTYTVSVTNSAGCLGKRSFDLTDTKWFDVNADSVNADCRFDQLGSVKALATNGFGPYAFYWYREGKDIGYGAEVSNLTPGVYTVRVEDKKYCQIIAQTTIRDYGVLDWNVSLLPVCGKELNDNKLTVSQYLLKNRVDYPLKVTLSDGTQEVFYNNLLPDKLAVYTDLLLGRYDVTVSDADGCSLTTSAVFDCPAAGPEVATNYPRLRVNEMKYYYPWQKDSSCASIQLLGGLNVSGLDFTIEWESGMKLAGYKLESIFSTDSVAQLTVDPLKRQLYYHFDNGEDNFSTFFGQLFKVCFLKTGLDKHPDIQFVEGPVASKISKISGQNMGFVGMSGKVHFESGSEYYNENFGIFPPDCLQDGYGQLVVKDYYYDSVWPSINSIHFNGELVSKDKATLYNALPGYYNISFTDYNITRQLFARVPNYGSFSCMWPGDIDRNGAVNMYDFAHIGTNVYSGNDNPFAVLNWYGQNGLYDDPNGDGYSDSRDTTAIVQNWGRVVNPFRDGVGDLPNDIYYKTDIQFAIDVQTDTLYWGEKGLLPIYLLDEDTINYPFPLKGGGFCINYDTSLFPFSVRFIPATNPSPNEAPVYASVQHNRNHHKADVGLWTTIPGRFFDSSERMLLGFAELTPFHNGGPDTINTALHTSKGLFTFWNNDYFPYEIEDLSVPIHIRPKTSSSNNEPSNNRAHWVQVMPNPADGYVEVRFGAHPAFVEIINVEGRVLRHTTPDGPYCRFELADLPAGWYAVRAALADGVETRPFVKR